jgi:CCR4-NOT transcription complex subunit 3
MEKFKAVEKEMKTKAFSKEGLSAAAKLDPKEKEKLEACQFLSNMVEELERQVETLEAEEEALQATVKKGKKDTGKADRLAEIGRLTERHKWHQGKLELLLRSLENGNVDTEQVHELQENIKYYVEENQSVEFVEDDAIYDDLNLEEDEGTFGMNNDIDKVSSQDTQSIQDDLPESADGRGPGISSGKPKSTSISEPQGASARRPSNQFKSPLPALATLHTPSANISNNNTITTMKPAPLPTRAPGETLKYASAAAAAAASEKNTVGIAPLPPPINVAAASASASAPPPTGGAGVITVPSNSGAKSSATTSPSVMPSLPASVDHTSAQKAEPPVAANPEGASTSQNPARSPTSSFSNSAIGTSNTRAVPPASTDEVLESSKVPSLAQPSAREPSAPEAGASRDTAPSLRPGNEQTNGAMPTDAGQDESIFHLPSGLQDLIQSFEATKSRSQLAPSPSVQRLLAASHATCPDFLDAEKPRHYRPEQKYLTPRYYPQEPFMTIDEPSLYGKIDTDTLFYIFYYRQNTYQQYMAAKSLKSQSWRFHKQYQTWFQRHEEPKTITEEYEQGTYRFFDYESTWYGLHVQSIQVTRKKACSM